jgi:fructuronate reductase
VRLTPATLDRLSPQVRQSRYEHQASAPTIVHFGVGAFHRAHQAVYTEDANETGESAWAIKGVSLRSAAVQEQMEPQGCLYTVTEVSEAGHNTRLIRSIRQLIVAPQDSAAVLAQLAHRDTQIVSFTITEKGYLTRTNGSLDFSSPDIASDLQSDSIPRSIFGFLGRALSHRRHAGYPGLTLLSCDNLTLNGAKLANLVDEYLERQDGTLARWFRAECACPSTMVDRIVPATTKQRIATWEPIIGVRDEAMVVTEPFRQWIIEDRFAGPRPRWERGGAQFVSDVGPFETAKLRILNGAHSALAYLGLEQGHEFVHQAIADSRLLPLIKSLMYEEAASILAPSLHQNLHLYADAILKRFGNAELPHRLDQIAIDGSQKIPQRWLDTLRIHQEAGQICPAILTALASWIVFVKGGDRAVDDPLATELAERWNRTGAEGIVNALFGAQGPFANHWVASDREQMFLNALVVERLEHRKSNSRRA